VLQRSALKDDLEILRFAQNDIYERSYREVSEDTRAYQGRLEMGSSGENYRQRSEKSVTRDRRGMNLCQSVFICG
jgi:hypothetical protein